MGAQPPFELQLLGPVEVRDRSGVTLEIPAGKPLALLIRLHLADVPLSRDHLGGLLWADSPRDRARASVRHALWFLRKELAEDLFEGDDPVSIAPGMLRSDLGTLLNHLERGNLEEADEIWTGDPPQLSDLADGVEWRHWAEDVRLDLEQRLSGALEARAARHGRAGQAAESARLLERALSILPDRPALHQARIETLLDARDFDTAASALARARRELAGRKADAALDRLEHRLRTLREGARSEAPTDTRALQLDFTGRETELRALTRGWRRAARGTPAVGLVTGEPGIGKTRLADELALVARSEGGRVVRLEADDSERPIEWGLLAEGIEQLLALSGAAGISHASDAVLRSLLPSLNPRDPAGSTGPERPTPHPIGDRPAVALSDALSDLIAAVSDDAPLLMVIDDLQWADSESRSVLTRLATRLRDTSAMLLFICRSRVESVRVQKSLTLLAESSRTTRIELGPWSHDDLIALLEGRIRFSGRGSGHAILRRIHETTRGNPLFVVELLRTFEQDGIIELEAGGRGVFHTERLPPDLPLPESLRALVDRQLAQLPEEAKLVAAHLARIGHPSSPRMLAGRSGLGISAVTNAVGDLLQRRMVHWKDPETLAFQHDELRAAVARRFQLHVGLTTGGGAQWSAFRTAVVATLALLMLGAVAYVFARPDRDEALFGGGTIVVQRAGEVESWRLTRPGVDAALEVVAADAGDRAPPPPEGTAGAPVRLVSGAIEWTPAGRLGLSPDGSQLLIHRPLPGDRHELLLRTREGADERRIYEGWRRPEQLDISPLGQRMLFLLPGRPDVLLVTTPGGHPLARWSSPRIVRVHWCGPQQILILLRQDDAVRATLWHPENDSESSLELPDLHVGGETACSPDGRAILLQGAREGRVGLYLHQPARGVVEPVALGDGPAPDRIHWVPDRVAPLPAGIRIAQGKHRRLDWGDQMGMDAELVFANGTTRIDTLQWESRDPDVVHVAPSGRVTAVGAGTAWIVAEWNGWLRDSIRIDVKPANTGGALVRERFEGRGMPGWIGTVGGPMHWERRDSIGGLRLMGDPDRREPIGAAWLVHDRTAALDRGLTLELEFRLQVTEDFGQWIALCLVQPGDRSPPTLLGFDSDAPSLGRLRQGSRQSACVRYPGADRTQWDPREISVLSHRSFPPTPVDVGEFLPSNEWTHLALALGTDGRVSAFLDRTLVGASPIFLDPASGPWRLVVMGEGWGSALEIRELALWPDLRYGPEGVPDA